MKPLLLLLTALLITTSVLAQDIPAEIDTVKLPDHRIRIFDKTIHPGLSESQKAKYAIIKLQKEIKIIQGEIKELEREITNKQDAISEVIALYNKEKKSFSSFLLGLYSEESKIKKDSVLTDEKSILWGAFKWGKLKKEEKKND